MLAVPEPAALFAPRAAEMCPPDRDQGFTDFVYFAGGCDKGARRPGHFSCVGSIVAKRFVAVRERNLGICAGASWRNAKLTAVDRAKALFRTLCAMATAVLEAETETITERLATDSNSRATPMWRRWSRRTSW